MIALMLAAELIGGQSKTWTRSELLAVAPAELAKEMLPAIEAEGIVADSVGRGMMGVPPPESVRFFTAARHVSQTTCRREARTALLSIAATPSRDPITPETPVHVSGRYAKVEIGLGDDCAAIPDEGFAGLNSGVPEAEAVAGLDWLAGIQKDAKSEARRVQIACRSEGVKGACKGGAHAVFATLPLTRIYVVEHSSQFILQGPGSCWRVDIVRDSDGERRIALTAFYPAPF